MLRFGNVLAFTLLLTGVFSLVFAVLAWRKHNEPGGNPLAVFNIAIAVALFAYATDILSTTRSVQLLALLIWFPLQAVVGVTWLYIAIEYAGFQRFATWRTKAALGLEPAVVALIGIVPSTRPLLFDLPESGIEGSLFFLGATGGPLLIVHYLYLNVVLVCGTVLLIRLVLQSNHLYRLQALAVALAAVAPWVALLAQVVDISPALQAVGVNPSEDPSAIAFAVSGMALTTGLYRFKTLDPVPAARETIVENMGDGVIVLSTEGTVSSINPAAKELLGAGPEGDALPGAHIEDLVPGWEQIDGETDHREREWHELSVTVDGTERFLEVQRSAFRDRFDRRVGQLVVIRDVTQRTRREQNLARYKTIFESVTDRVFVLDAAGRIVVANQPFSELLETRPEQLEGRAFADVLATDEALPTDGAPMTVEREVETGSGETIPCEIRLAPISLEGVEAGAVGILRDISQRRQIESSLQRTTERLETIVEASPVAIVATDTDGRVEVWNDAATEMFGWSAEAVQGEFLPVVSGDAERQLQSLADRVANGEPVTGRELTLDCKDGSVVDASLSMAPITDDSGAVEGIVGLVTDITDQKDRERRLQRQNERLDEFAGLLSHDLRNPLQVVSSRLQLLSVDAGLDSDAKEHLDHSQSALDRMETLIDDALALAREGEDIGETQPFVLGDLATRAWQTVETPTAQLTVDDPEHRPIEGDPTRVIELFENLFRNSVEHGSTSPDSHTRQDAVEHGSTGSQPGADDAVEHGRAESDEEELTICVQRLPDGFAVEDDGVGIDDQHREQLFETGYTTDPDGTGFGLAIVERIASAHGWTVSVTDSADGGARFEFETA